MDNKLNNMLNDFLKDVNVENEEDLNIALQKFMGNYNLGDIEYENTPLDDAYELLEKAQNAKTKNRAIKLAKEAYDMCPDCFDAILFQVQLEDDVIKREKILNDGLIHEEERLKREDFFDKENIGHFYGIFETRPYIRGLYMKASYLLVDGKIKLARDVCQEILRLNKNDNTGARYLLTAIYAFLEEEKEVLELNKKYKEENLEMLFPLFALYYKLGNYKKAQQYLDKINKANPHFIKYFKGTIKEKLEVPEGYYRKGDLSEVLMYFSQYAFLVNTLGTIDTFILKNLK